MATYCVDCGSETIGSTTCSMCYGDPDHGGDGYYRAWLTEREREEAEREQDELAQLTERNDGEIPF